MSPLSGQLDDVSLFFFIIFCLHSASTVLLANRVSFGIAS
jgi:hypothetical protein